MGRDRRSIGTTNVHLQYLLVLGLAAVFVYGSPLQRKALSQEEPSSVRERALEQFDANRDGRLDVLEREEIRKAGKPFAVKRPRYVRDRRRHRQRLKLYDTNGDGELSEAEEEAAEKLLQRTWNRLSEEYGLWEDDRPVVKNLERLRRDAKEGRVKDFPLELYDWIEGTIKRASQGEEKAPPKPQERPPSRHQLAPFDQDRNGRLDVAELNAVRMAMAGNEEETSGDEVVPTAQSSAIETQRRPGSDVVRISEFMADNETGLVDEQGELVDWIEIHNSSGAPVSLAGWSLTDSKVNDRKWVFPEVEMAPDEYLIVFASGKNRRRAGRPLHTNFQLNKNGDELRMIGPGDAAAKEAVSTYPEQKADVSFGSSLGTNGGEGESLGFLAFPTPGRRNSLPRRGALSTITLSQPHGLYKESFVLESRSADPDVHIRYTTDGSKPNESSPVLSEAFEITETTILRAQGYKPGYAPTPIVTRSYIFPADRIDHAADGLPPEDYWYEWGEGKANYGLDAEITQDPRLREKLLRALWAIPSYSLAIEPENLFSDERGIYAHAGWHGRKAERNCSLELLPTADQQEAGFQIDAGVRMRGGSSRHPRYQKHAMRFFFRKQYGQAKLEYDLFKGEGTQAFDNFDLRCTQQYSWHHGFNPRAIYIRDQFSRDLHLAMGQTSPRGNFRHLYINGHYWGIFNTCERPEASFGEAYIGGKKKDFDVVKIMGGYSEDHDQQRHYQVGATDGNKILWEKLDRLSQLDLSDPRHYAELLGLNSSGEPDPKRRRLIDPVNLIDYMLVLFYTGNLDSSISWFGRDRGANNWHGLMNRKKNIGFRFIVWDAEHTMLEIIEDRLGPFPMETNADRSNPTWLYQRLLENEEFRVLVSDRIGKHFFRDGVLTPEHLTRLFDRRIAEIEPGLFAEAARWGNPRKTYEEALRGSELRVEEHNSGVAKHNLWPQEVARTRNEYIPQRSAVVLEQLFGRGLYPDLPEIEVRWSGENGRHLTLAAEKFAIYYTKDGQDPRMYGGEMRANARLYNQPLVVVDGEMVACRIREGDEWGALRILE